jgi:flagellar protein FlaG
MSMSISSAQTTAGVTTEKNLTINVPSKAYDEAVIKHKSVEALQEADRKGSKISIGEEQKVKSIERALEAVKSHQTSLEMSVHEETNEVVIRVLDKETGELIREVPSEKILDMVSKFMEMNGMLFDEKV